MQLYFSVTVMFLFLYFIAPMIASVQCVHINLEDPGGVKDVFLDFVTNICSSFKETQDQVEQVIVSQQKL